MKSLRWDRLLPRSLGGRVVLVLMLGLTMFHLGSLWLHQVEIVTLRGEARNRQIANAIGLAHRMLEAGGAEEREQIAHALSFPGLELHWGKTPAAGLRDRTGQSVENALARQLRDRLPSLAGSGLRLSGTVADDNPHALLGAAPLSDGSWLNFSVTVLRPVGAEHLTILSTTAMGMGILLLSLVVVRLIGRPLRALSDAADRVGFGDRLPPLPEDGPREVRHAARAFNRMQDRIDQLITDRTQALAAVSHDLRTPIARLRMRAGFIEDTDLQRRIDADLDEMDGMIEGTLDYLRGRHDNEPIRPVNLAAILETLCDDATDQGHAARYDGPPQARVCGQPLALKRCFANLLDNAVKYGQTAAVSLRADPTEIVVEIADRGPGIPAASLASAFEPFRRLDPARGHGGAGLGLAIARQVVLAHQGTITLENGPNGGLLARVRLPRDKDQGALPPETPTKGVTPLEPFTGSDERGG